MTMRYVGSIRSTWTRKSLWLPFMAALASASTVVAGPILDSPPMSLESAVRYQVEEAVPTTRVRVDVHVQEPASNPPKFSLDIMLPAGFVTRAELPRRAPGEASYVNPYAPPKAPEPETRTQLDTVRDVVAAACASWDRMAETTDWRRDRIADLNVYFSDDGHYWSTPFTSCRSLVGDPADTMWKLGWRTASNGPPFVEQQYLRYAKLDGLPVDVRMDADGRPVLILRTRVARGGVEQAAIDRDTARFAREMISAAIRYGQSVAAVQVYVNDAGRHWDLDDIRWKVDFLNLPDADLLGLAQRIDAASPASTSAPDRAPAEQGHTPAGSATAAETDQQRRWADLERREAASADCKKGIALLTGDGVAKDPVQANKYFARLADAGDSCGQLLLGLNLYLGQGVPTDELKGLTLIRQAAAQGHPGAIKALREIEEP